MEGNNDRSKEPGAPRVGAVDTVDAARQARRDLLAREVQNVLAAKRWSLQQAERETGIPASTVARLKDGLSVKTETVLLFAAKTGGDRSRWEKIAVGIDPDTEDFLHRIGAAVDISLLRRVPHSLGKASASPTMTVEAIGEQDGTLGDILPTNIRSIEVSGDCMKPFYENGDVLLVRETDAAEPGDKVIALVDGIGITCKIYGRNGRPWLEPSSGEGRIEAGRFRIIGIVDALIRPERRISLRH